MAKKFQCEQCDAFIMERGLCRKEWKLAEFDDTDCPYYNGKKDLGNINDNKQRDETLVDDNGKLNLEKGTNLESNNTDEGKSIYEDSAIKAANLLVKVNMSKQNAVKALVADGLSEVEAGYVVENVVSYIRKKRIEESGEGFIKGCLFIIIGLAVTGITYVWASIRGGGMYIVTYGAVAVGAIIMIIAIVNFIRALLYKR